MKKKKDTAKKVAPAVEKKDAPKQETLFGDADMILNTLEMERKD